MIASRVLRDSEPPDPLPTSIAVVTLIVRPWHLDACFELRSLGEAAIDNDIGLDPIAAGGGGDENHRFGDLIWLAEAARRHFCQSGIVKLRHRAFDRVNRQERSFSAEGPARIRARPCRAYFSGALGRAAAAHK
jgi:hypothetical protein